MTSTTSLLQSSAGDAAPLPPAVPTSLHPIIPGFHPDPTICRVGNDYYLANSSFEFSPGVPVWHSTDLLAWTLIGNALTRDDQFPAGTASASSGVYAPTLRHHDGTFWLITTDVSGGGGQLVVSSADAAGPWSASVHLRELTGIDPDLAWDEQGNCFVSYCSTDPTLPGIAQARVDLHTGAVVTDPQTLWRGTGLAFPEAPHLYHRDGWWYLVIAEGGTERGHTVTVARSRRPDGPFEGSPKNPVFSHRSTSHPVQNTGHADFVENPDGSWAMVYLGVRPRGTTPMFHVNGRETFLAGVDWIDGWPVVDENRYLRAAPDLSFSDSFESVRLHPRWVSPGAAIDAQVISSGEPGLTLRPALAASGAISAVVTRTMDQSWSFEADVSTTGGLIGLLVRLDDRHWCEARFGDGHAVAVLRVGDLEVSPQPPTPVSGHTAVLRAESLPSLTEGPDDIRLSIIVGGTETMLARVDGRYLSTEVAGGFTGRVIGVRAIDGSAQVREARYRGDGSRL